MSLKSSKLKNLKEVLILFGSCAFMLTKENGCQEPTEKEEEKQEAKVANYPGKNLQKTPWKMSSPEAGNCLLNKMTTLDIMKEAVKYRNDLGSRDLRSVVVSGCNFSSWLELFAILRPCSAARPKKAGKSTKAVTQKNRSTNPENRISKEIWGIFTARNRSGCKIPAFPIFAINAAVVNIALTKCTR